MIAVKLCVIDFNWSSNKFDMSAKTILRGDEFDCVSEANRRRTSKEAAFLKYI
jgi:hypothetical protein